MSKKNENDLIISELFMAKRGNDFSQCFYGTIRREADDNGDPIVYGKIEINGGYIVANARDQWELGEKLDEMVMVVLSNPELHTKL